MLHEGGPLADGKVHRDLHRLVRGEEDEVLGLEEDQLLVEVPALQGAVGVREALVHEGLELLRAGDLADADDPACPALGDARRGAVRVLDLAQRLDADADDVGAQDALEDVAHGVLAVAAWPAGPEGLGHPDAEGGAGEVRELVDGDLPVLGEVVPELELGDLLGGPVEELQGVLLQLGGLVQAPLVLPGAGGGERLLEEGVGLRAGPSGLLEVPARGAGDEHRGAEVDEVACLGVEALALEVEEAHRLAGVELEGLGHEELGAEALLDAGLEGLAGEVPPQGAGADLDGLLGGVKEQVGRELDLADMLDAVPEGAAAVGASLDPAAQGVAEPEVAVLHGGELEDLLDPVGEGRGDGAGPGDDFGEEAVVVELGDGGPADERLELRPLGVLLVPKVGEDGLPLVLAHPLPDVAEGLLDGESGLDLGGWWLGGFGDP